MIPIGFSDLSFAPQPVFRFAQQRVSGPEGQLFSFEQLLLASAGFLAKQADNRIGIKFGQSVHAIPRISGSRILQENYLPELISNRFVIIGEAMPESAGMLTPASATQRMPRLEVRGHVLLTLLSGRPLQKASSMSSVCCLAICWIGLCFVFRELDYRYFPSVVGILCIIALAVAFLTFSFLSICSPITGLLFLLTTVPVCFWFARFRILSEFVSAFKIRLQSNSVAASNLQTEDPWKHITAAVDQFFGAQRAAFFELRPEDQTLQLVHTVGVGDEGIYERRRDINRDPWRRSIELGRTKQNRTRLIFTPDRGKNPEAGDLASIDGDTEFIVPLMCKGKIFGFMVLEMSSEHTFNWPDFENVLDEFAADFSQMIDQSRRSKIPNRAWENLNETPEHRESDQIARQLQQSDTSKNQIEQAFETDSCCRMLFDSFGSVINVNSRMIRRLEADKPVSEFTFTDLIQSIADVNVQQAREIFRSAILFDQRTDLETKSGNLHGNIVISPVELNDNSGRELFSRGILIEIFDAREHASFNKLAKLFDAPASLVKQVTNAAGQPNGESVLAEIESLISAASDVVASRRDGSFDSVWRAALFNSQPRLQKTNLTIETKFDGAESVVVRDRDRIVKTIEVCLSVLAECSRHSDTLNVKLDRNASQWKLEMRNGPDRQDVNWSSPSILDKRQIERLFAEQQEMETCGGSVGVEDASSGEILIWVSFPAGNLKAMSGKGSTEACDV
jgi:hypothetical protein